MGRIVERITALNMVHAYPTHVSAGYRILDGMLMVKTDRDEDDMPCGAHRLPDDAD